jgi:hypothetical protein
VPGSRSGTAPTVPLDAKDAAGKRPRCHCDTKRYRVRFRLGGAESVPRFAGSFKNKRDADTRRAWVLGELAAMRVPDMHALAASQATTVNEAADRWLKSRVDVSEGTMQT